MLEKMLRSLIENTPYMTANLANASALLADALKDINWAGFYLMEGGKLVLGPFQGKVACVEIAVGKGVCGTAVERKEIVRVENVHEFPGHIACDCASNSEIVIPLLADGEVMGVLDIDSPLIGRFTAEDEEGLSRIGKVLEMLFTK
ncbi:MAG: GAF domain-containing protein [Oscillospiraceae bacterium]|nr:GAF domain-containing protein [Oscillospiraceae bacterium]